MGKYEYGTVEYWRDFRNQMAKDILVKMIGDEERMAREWGIYNSDRSEDKHLSPQAHAAVSAISYAIELADRLMERDMMIAEINKTE